MLLTAQKGDRWNIWKPDRRANYFSNIVMYFPQHHDTIPNIPEANRFSVFTQCVQARFHQPQVSAPPLQRNSVVMVLLVHQV